jgi:quaternary ammonium compound-resistance protein SugE
MPLCLLAALQVIREIQPSALLMHQQKKAIISSYCDRCNGAAKGKHMAWVILVIAGLFEVGWAIGLKYTEGFTRLWPTVGTALAMILSLWLLGIAMKSLPVGTAYSVWVGVGAVGTVVLGIVLLGEPANAARFISVGLILAGIVGLKLATPV